MNAVSEKQLYADELEEVAIRSGLEHFVWGEELIHHKLIVYAKKIKDVGGYEHMKDNLEPCGLVVTDIGNRGYMRCMPATLNVLNGDIYLTETNFNAAWKYLRKSIQTVILAAKEQGMPCDIHKPEAVVELCGLLRENSRPYIKNGKIQYQANEPDETQRMEISRRQRLLDKPEMKYFYAVTGRYYHDKECEDVKGISIGDFCASEEIPTGKAVCPKCRRKIYFRQACAPNAKQIPVCDRIFRNHRVADVQIMHFVLEAGLKFHATTLHELTVEGAEDVWIIRETEGQQLQLWHNNYVKTSETERYITEGFHNQGLKGKSLLQMLQYIEGYTWEKHLQGEAAKKIAALAGQEEPLKPIDGVPGHEVETEKQVRNEKTSKEGRIRTSMQRIKLWIEDLIGFFVS